MLEITTAIKTPEPVARNTSAMFIAVLSQAEIYSGVEGFC
jgi:hypothetical protein